MTISLCWVDIYPTNSESLKEYGKVSLKYTQLNHPLGCFEFRKSHLQLPKQCFWMKNCLIPLDIIVIKNNVIVNIHHNCPPCDDEFDCPSYCGNGNIVLEVEGGTCEIQNIQAGDSVEYILD